MYNWAMDLLYAWIASISSAISPIVIKASSKSIIKNPWLFNILWVATGIPMVAIYAIVRGAGIPQDWSAILFLSAAYAVFYILYTFSLFRVDVSVIGPLFSLRTVFAVLLGVILLGEAFTPLQFALILIIVGASPFSAYSEKFKLRAFLEKPVLIAVAAMFVLALVGYFTNRSSHINGNATTLLWMDLFSLIFLLPTLKFAGLSKESVTRHKLVPFFFLGLTGFGYTVAANEAYSRNLALSSAIVSLPLSMILAVVLSKRFGLPLEKHSNKVYVIRFSAAAIMVTSAITLSLI
jgi:drug/metabolite transporter (DMT)-like permease